MNTELAYLPQVAEVLSALSHALDITEGQLKGHAERTAFIAVRMAKELGLSEEQQTNTFYASLLKDCGCSNNSARIQKIFGGDELLAKQRVKFIDWSNPAAAAAYAFKYVAPGAPLGHKLRRVVEILGTPEDSMDGLTHARCTRGSEIARQLGFDQAVATAIFSLDEHWDGKGASLKLKGDAIPLLSQIIGLSQTLEIFVTAYGVDAGYDMLERRKGKWFSKDMVRAAFAFRQNQNFWGLHALNIGDITSPLPRPDFNTANSKTEIDNVCNAFASIIDAKSTFTGEHSSRVKNYSVEIATAFGFDRDRVTTLSRAALLHDIGKLGVSNAILDKPGKLTDEEFSAIKLHPMHTHEILSQIKGFERITEVAAAHHEKLNGKGYWRGLGADQLDLDMRIVAVADVFDALTAKRPYRDALSYEEVFKIMDKEANETLDGECIEALKANRGLSVRRDLTAA